MNLQRFAFLASMLVCSATTALAAPITGDPSADSGWILGGNSLANGTYVRGEGTFSFDIYSAAFQVETGSNLDIADGDFSWLPGDQIMGLGGKFVDTNAVDAGWPAFLPNAYSGGGVVVNDDVSGSSRPVAKFGTAGTSFTTSTTAPFQNGNGNGSLSGGAAGDGTLLTRITVNRTSGGANIIGFADLVQRYDGDGDVVLANTGSADVIDANFARTARMIYTWNGTGGHIDSWQYLVNLSLMEREFDYAVYPTLGDQAVMTVQRSTGRFTDGLVQLAAVPEPSTIALAGLAGMFGTVVYLRRRWS